MTQKTEPIRGEFKKDGYSREEEYFHRKNKELLREHRRKLDDARVAQRTLQQSKAHWMICPKCGGQMHEVSITGVEIDRCSSCQGLYLDRGELELLFDERTPKGFLESFKEKLRDSFMRADTDWKP